MIAPFPITPATTMSETLVTCPVCRIPNFTEQGLRAHRCKGPLAAAASEALAKRGAGGSPAAIDGQAEVLPAAIPLSVIKSALEAIRGKLVQQEEAFFQQSLPDRLKIGLRCYQAHLIFAHNPGKGGRPGKTVTRDGSTPESFESWLADEAPWLKKPTAYKYMTAFRGLCLDEKATEEQVEFTLETLRHAQQQAGLPAPSLANLVAAATDRLAPPAETPAAAAPPHQLTLDDYLATLKSFRQDADTVIEQAKDMPENLRKAACARAYATLAALTGTAWQPSEEHDELGTLDPDTFTL